LLQKFIILLGLYFQIDEDELVGISSIKGSSEYSCASSFTDDDLTGSKAPGVVARLMGLDSMPTSTTSEPYCTPFRDTRCFRENYSLKRSPEYCGREPLTNNLHRIENNSYMRRPIDLRAQKMPSSPIERFQMEALPPRSAKPLPMTYHKLLSPIKNPRFASTRNAAQIMEAAAKILEPRLQSVGNGREKVCSFGSGRVGPYPKESVMASQRTSRLLQMSRVHVESGEAHFSRGNREEDIVIFRSSPDPYDASVGSTSGSTNVKGNNNKGKSVSLAIQAKVNVQKREGVNSSNRHSGFAQKVHDDSRLNQAFRSQSGTGNSTTNQRTNIKQQKKQGSSNSSVLKQNNQKQNCTVNRSKSGTRKSSSSQQGRKGISCESSSSKHKSLSRLATSSKPRSTIELEKEDSFSSNKDFPQKKRLIERSINNSDKHNQGVRQNVVIDEFSKWNKETKDTTDVVSFTSPLVKQAGNVQYQILGSEKLGLVGGANEDALSLLLEQMLRELTTRIEPSSDFDKGISFGSLEQDFAAEGDAGWLKDGRRNGFSKDAGIYNFSKHQAPQVRKVRHIYVVNNSGRSYTSLRDMNRFY
jgi:DUF761-associated sequence motif